MSWLDLLDRERRWEAYAREKSALMKPMNYQEPLHPSTPPMPDFEQYSRFARRTAQYPQNSTYEAVNYLVHLLNSEAGEVAGKLQKLIRDSDVRASVLNPSVRHELLLECGDCLWALAELGYWLGEQPHGDREGFEHMAELNLSKLLKRQEAGTIKGSGDHR